MATRRRYTKEFKLEAIRLAQKPGASVQATAEALGIGKSALHSWIKQLSVDGDQAFPGNGRLKADDEEIRKLRQELKRVTEERDILKRATLFFAQEARKK
jgi:transposase